MSFKVQKVVMLPTNQKAAVGMLALFHELYNNTKWYLSVIHRIEMQDYLKVWTYSGQLTEGPDAIAQAKYHHLYVISDDEIREGDLKDGDYYYYFNQIKQWKEIDKDNPVIRAWSSYKKIIATTDKTLGITLLDEAFALDFRDYYNNNNFATEAIVENVAVMSNTPYISDEFKNRLKALKESSGIGCKFKIKHPKNSYTKKEVYNIAAKAHSHGYSLCLGTTDDMLEFEDWIKTII